MSDLVSALPHDLLYYLTVQYVCPPDTRTGVAKCGCRLLAHTTTVKLSKQCQSLNVRPTIGHYMNNCRPNLSNLATLMCTSKTIHDKLVASKSVKRLVTLLAPQRPTALSHLVSRGLTVIYKSIPDVLNLRLGPKSNPLFNQAVKKARLGTATHLYGVIGQQRAQSLLKLRHLLTGNFYSFVICAKLGIPIYYEHLLELEKDISLWRPIGNENRLMWLLKDSDPKQDLTFQICLLFKKRWLVDWMVKDDPSHIPIATNLHEHEPEYEEGISDLRQRILRFITVKIKTEQVPTLQDMCKRGIRPTFGTLKFAIAYSRDLFAFQTLFFYFGQPLTDGEGRDLVSLAVQHDRLEHLLYLERYMPVSTSEMLTFAVLSKSWRTIGHYANVGLRIPDNRLEQVRAKVPLDAHILTESLLITLLRVGYFDRNDSMYLRAIEGSGDLMLYLAKTDMDFLRWSSANVARALTFQTLLIAKVP